MCRLGGVGKAAARCWVGVPNHVTRLSVVQDLAEFRLATCLFLSLAATINVFLDADQEEIMSQCEWVRSMCRLGMADKATARCWVGVTMGVPSDEKRLLIGQDLVQFRLATCFLLSLVAAIIVLLDAEQEEIMSQCGMCQQMYRLGVTGASAAQSHTSAHTQYIDLPLHVMFFLIIQKQVLRLESIITEQFAAIAFAHSVIPGLVVNLVLVLFVCNRSARALPDSFGYHFDELSS